MSKPLPPPLPSPDLERCHCNRLDVPHNHTLRDHKKQ